MMPSNADLMLEGYICQFCGELLDGDNPGYPRTCKDCSVD